MGWRFGTLVFDGMIEAMEYYHSRYLVDIIAARAESFVLSSQFS